MFQKNLISNAPGGENDQNGFVLFKIICSILLTATVTAMISLWQQPHYAVRFITAMALLWVVSLSFIFTLKASNVRTVAALYIGFIMMLILGFSFTGGGIKAHIIRLLPVVILFAGLTVGRKAMCFFAIAACFSGFLLVLADYYKLLPVTEPVTTSAAGYWIYSVAGIFLFYYIEHLSVNRFNKTVVHLKEELSLRKQSEEKYRVIFESFQDVYYQTDMLGNIVLITPSIKRWAGYEPNDLLGKNVAVFYADTIQRDAFISLLLKKKAVYNYELEVLTKDGKIMNILASSQILYDSAGEPTAIEGTLHDITRRKAQENVLK